MARSFRLLTVIERLKGHTDLGSLLQGVQIFAETFGIHAHEQTNKEVSAGLCVFDLVQKYEVYDDQSWRYQSSLRTIAANCIWVRLLLN